MKHLMIALWLAALGVGCLIGCGASAGKASPAEPTTAQRPMPAPEQKQEPTDVPQQPTSPTKPKAPKGDKPDNPSRLHQLNDLERVTVKIDGKPFRVWVMDTFSKQQEGMMFLREAEVKPDEGMIFVYNEAEPRSFWMRNTYLPLDIAFVGPEQRILNIAAAKALDETGVPSAGPAQWVLEFRQGTLKRHGIRAGAKVEIPAGLKFRDE